jgi:acyl carrier protein
MNDPIAAEIRKHIVEMALFGEGGDRFSDVDSLFDKRIMESAAIFEVVMFVENTYGIEISDAELTSENLDSIARMAAFVRRKQAG